MCGCVKVFSCNDVVKNFEQRGSYSYFASYFACM